MNKLFGAFLALSIFSFSMVAHARPVLVCPACYFTSTGLASGDIQLQLNKIFADTEAIDSNTFILGSTDRWDIYAGGHAFTFSTTNSSNRTLQITNAANNIQWASATKLNGGTDGSFLITDTVGTSGFNLTVGGNGVATLANIAGTVNGQLVLANLVVSDSVWPNQLKIQGGATTYQKMADDFGLQWSSTSSYAGTIDLEINRNAAGVIGMVSGTKGTVMTNGCYEETLTFAAGPGGDASKDTTNLIADGAWLKFVNSRVLTAGTNCTDIDIGQTGGVVNIYADASSVADTTTTTNANAQNTWANPQGVAGGGAQDVTVTANGGNCFDLVISIVACYETSTAPTSD